MLTFGSLFAGYGGFDIGLERLGWLTQWQVEIDPAANKVLAAHWPGVPRYEDITEVHGDQLQPVDAIVGGFPCQDLSVAGRRAGMTVGTRSGLFYEFARIVKEMRDATDGLQPHIVIWENVPGLLSLGNTLGAIYAQWDSLGALVQEHRVVDTGRAFGIPQRRRRVLGIAVWTPGAESWGPILLDPESSRRDPEAGQQTCEDAAGTLGGGTPGRGWSDDTDRMTFLPTVTTRVGQPGNQSVDDGSLIPTHTGTITANWHKGAGNTQVEEGIVIPFVKARRAHHDDDFETWSNAHHSPTLNGRDNNSPGTATVAVAEELGVRRLTPLECERLMGLDDHWTVPAGADTHRYRLCGNGLIPAAAEWVGRRIERGLQG